MVARAHMLLAKAWGLVPLALLLLLPPGAEPLLPAAVALPLPSAEGRASNLCSICSTRPECSRPGSKPRLAKLYNT